MANDPSSRATVLIVDDDPLVRMIAVDFVEDSGFRAVEAENADEAIAILESRADIESLVTDIAMPGEMDGVGLALAVHQRWALMRIIVVSGAVQPSKAELPPHSHFLQKPYAADALIALLGAPAGRQ
jgi:CheY-like chemotaxis protein